MMCHISVTRISKGRAELPISISKLLLHICGFVFDSCIVVNALFSSRLLVTSILYKVVYFF